jgi:glycosyltransferase involved in cell wall biosynthesis
MTTFPAPTLSIIIPVLNEAAGIVDLLQSLQGLRAQEQKSLWRWQ